jgi:hypothetical protein
MQSGVCEDDRTQQMGLDHARPNDLAEVVQAQAAVINGKQRILRLRNLVPSQKCAEPTMRGGKTFIRLATTGLDGMPVTGSS